MYVVVLTDHPGHNRRQTSRSSRGILQATSGFSSALAQVNPQTRDVIHTGGHARRILARLLHGVCVGGVYVVVKAAERMCDKMDGDRPGHRPDDAGQNKAQCVPPRHVGR
jgi:hypothetical protein